MNKLKITLILLSSFIFVFMFGCIKPTSTALSGGSNNHFLANYGADYSAQPNLYMDSAFGTILGSFFSNKNPTLFNMNFSITPKAGENPVSQSSGEILDQLRTIVSELDSDSTLVWYFNTHGNKEVIVGADDGKITPKLILENIEEGRQGKGPFQRMIVLSLSCNSGSHMPAFRDRNKATTYNEGYYIASSDAELPSSGIASTGNWNLLLPVFLFLRAQQLNAGQDYSVTYQQVEQFVRKKNPNFYIDIFNGKLKEYHITLNDLITTKFTNSNEETKTVEKEPRSFDEKNPTVMDLKNIIENIRKITPKDQNNPDHFSMDIFYDSGLKNAPLF